MHFYRPNSPLTSVSWQDHSADADANGVVDLPEEAAADLAAFGIIPGDPAPAEPAEVTVPISQWKNVDLLAKADQLGLQLPPDIKRPDLIKAVTDAINNPQPKA
jgi:hypothetical protein